MLKEKKLCIDLIDMMIGQMHWDYQLGNNTKYQVILLKYFALQFNHFESLRLLVDHLRIVQIAPIVRCMLEIYAQMDFLSEDNSKKVEKINHFLKYDEFIRFCVNKPVDSCSDEELSNYKEFLKKKDSGNTKNPRNENNYYQNWFEIYGLNLSDLIKNSLSKRGHDGSKIFKNIYSFLSKLTHSGPTGLLEMINDENKIIEVHQNPKRLCDFIYSALTIMELTINIVELEFDIIFISDDNWIRKYREQFVTLGMK